MPDPMEGPARTRLVALVVLLALALPLTIVAVVGSAGGDDEEVEEAGLRVERSAGVSELIVFLDPDVNTPERTGGRPSVLVECLDEAGGVVARSDEPFPFTDTDQETRDPHVHVRINPARINDVVSCRVRPANPPLAGPVV